MSAQRIIRGASIMALDGRDALRRTDVLVQDGHIAAIAGVDQAGADIEEVRGVLMPGLVQASLHLDLSLQDLGFISQQDPIVHHRVQRRAWQSALQSEHVQTSAQAGLAWALAAGATSVVDPSSVRHAASTLAAAETVGSRVMLFVDATQSEASEALVVLREALAAQDMDTRVSVGIWAGAAEQTPMSVLSRAARLAIQEQVPLMVSAGLLPGARGAVERLERAGGLNRHLVFVHGHGQSLGGLKSHEKIARAEASVVITPSFAVMTGAPAAPLVSLLEAGVAVGLGSDSGGPRLGLDLFCEARLALRQLEGQVARPASTALRMATRHGAAALGLSTGSLEVGRCADLLLIGIEGDANDDHEALARRVLHSAGPEHIHQIWVHGEAKLSAQRTDRGPEPARIEQARQVGIEAVHAAMASWGTRSHAAKDVLRRQLRRLRGWHTGVWP